MADDTGVWVKIHPDYAGSAGELPGLGGWATITDVKGKGNKYSYTDADGDWIAYEWTADGELETTAGLVDVLLVGGGGGGNPSKYDGGAGGYFLRGLRKMTAIAHTVTIGAGGRSGTATEDYSGKLTFLGTLHTQVSGFGIGGGDAVESMGRPSAVDDILPTVLYVSGRSSGDGADNWNIKPTYGGGAGDGLAAQDGTCIVRVPKTNDLFKDIAGSEAGEPFDIPTTRQAIVEAVEEKVEEAKEAFRDRRNERRKRR